MARLFRPPGLTFRQSGPFSGGVKIRPRFGLIRFWCRRRRWFTRLPLFRRWRTLARQTCDCSVPRVLLITQFRRVTKVRGPFHVTIRRGRRGQWGLVLVRGHRLWRRLIGRVMKWRLKCRPPRLRLPFPRELVQPGNPLMFPVLLELFKPVHLMGRLLLQDPNLRVGRRSDSLIIPFLPLPRPGRKWVPVRRRRWWWRRVPSWKLQKWFVLTELVRHKPPGGLLRLRPVSLLRRP